MDVLFIYYKTSFKYNNKNKVLAYFVFELLAETINKLIN